MEFMTVWSAIVNLTVMLFAYVVFTSFFNDFKARHFEPWQSGFRKNRGGK